MSYRKEYDGVDLPTNPNMPVWVLTPKEEQVIFERWRAKTFARCDSLIKAYVECSNSYENPIDAMKKCEEANQRSLGCVAKYQTMEYLDQERDIMIAEKKVKQKAYREKLKQAQAAKEV
ncbi:putative tRNA-splicing endonuclease subunit [Clavispora lusitaniae]|uniref:tRNA-splicing endonuclease subunit n=1 Tax=Clavispora lusitaniae TaxID=36911 RepID=A0ACD0WI42_CLALS|nr:putative tRNA-splicing endonuclease subunit [Clavispora lusitaniae]QFZ33480.1 putative tRNA-splicing endonuclease subunit [Clavispora lusitaniae]QFZ39151.1 putative tRNA-splicing endonuclease subunit [Clavispora lusitaniae]QFZ44833.1 putative tRNA-splicing endonuclease subunit [Clavispora lusitaniae]QFZ50510.1 putative tRNA-splicing endonuclease subunit [Clavispora lusitaniae]